MYDERRVRKKVLLKSVLTPFCACVSTSELILAAGSEADRAHHDGYVALPLAATAAPDCLVLLRFGTHDGHCNGLW